MLDVHRLFEQSYKIPRLDREVVRQSILDFREYCLATSREQGIEVLPQQSALARRWPMLLAVGDAQNHLGNLLHELIRTPRRLKETLRAAQVRWELLKGEIDLDDLIIAGAISSAAPEVIDFLDENFDYIKACRGDDSERRASSRAPIEERWQITKETISVKDRSICDSLWRHLMGYLQTERSTESQLPLQSIAREKYWRRFLEMSFTEGVRDQDVLRDLRGFNEDIAPPRLVAVIKTMKDDALQHYAKDYLDTAEHFLREGVPFPYALSDAALLQAASLVFRETLVRFGADSTDDDAVAFIPLWRILLKRQPPKGYVKWLIDEALAAMRTSLSLAVDIFYFWGGIKGGPLRSEDAESVRRSMVAKAKTWKASDLVRIISIQRSWALLHFFRANGYREEVSDDYSGEEWSWLGRKVLAALKLNQTRILCAACLLICESDMSFDDERRHVRKVSISDNTLRRICRSTRESDDYLRAIASGKVDVSALGLREDDLLYVEAVISEARSRVSSME